MSERKSKVETSLDEAVVKEQCRQLRLPTVAAQCTRLAEEASRLETSHLRYLSSLLY